MQKGKELRAQARIKITLAEKNDCGKKKEKAIVLLKGAIFPHGKTVSCL